MCDPSTENIVSSDSDDIIVSSDSDDILERIENKSKVL